MRKHIGVVLMYLSVILWGGWRYAVAEKVDAIRVDLTCCRRQAINSLISGHARCKSLPAYYPEMLVRL